MHQGLQQLTHPLLVQTKKSQVFHWDLLKKKMWMWINLCWGACRGTLQFLLERCFLLLW
jgi:hypothetical protein